jgi:lipid A disaccharide synthetase
MAIQELLGFDCTPEKITAVIEELLADPAKRAHMAEDYAEIRRKLGEELPETATARTARMLDEMLG